MKVREMRTQIAQEIKEGNIKQIGNPPSAIGGTIAMLNKEQCDNIIADSQIHWDDLKDAVAKREGYMHQRRVEGGQGGQGQQGNPLATAKGRKDEASLEEKMEQINQNQFDGEGSKPPPPKDNDDLKFFTSKDAKNIEEVKDIVGIHTLTGELMKQKELFTELVRFNGKNIDENSRSIIKTNDLLTNTIDTTKEQMERLNNKIEENQGGDIHIVSHKPKSIKLADEHYHPQFKNIMQMLPLAKQVMLVGDAGTGKTFVANQIANALELQFKHISCSGGMSEGMLIGKMIFDGSFVSTDFLNCYENGGVFLLDEMDSADANLLVVLNSALANGYLSVPNRKDNPTAERHEDFLLIACCNTFGTGNGSRIYAGRNRLDGATLDRFYTIDFDYDTKLEFKLAGKQKWMMKAVHTLRDEVKRQRLDKVVSTRWIQQGQMTLDNTKKNLKEFLTEKTLSWTDAEKRKVDLVGIIDRFQDSSKGAK